MLTRPDIYGEVIVGSPPLPTQHVSRIHGFRVGRVEGKPAGIDLHFEAGGKDQSMTIPLPDALFLLSTLKSFQLDEDLPFPEDPRDHTWKASAYKSNRKS